MPDGSFECPFYGTVQSLPEELLPACASVLSLAGDRVTHLVYDVCTG
jgi:hypothetical protein